MEMIKKIKPNMCLILTLRGYLRFWRNAFIHMRETREVKSLMENGTLVLGSYRGDLIPLFYKT